MEEIIIYKYQLEIIRNVLRLTNNIHESEKGLTCFDRQVRQAKEYADNVIKGDKDKRVHYI
jgi:hypothetical protein